MVVELLNDPELSLHYMFNPKVMLYFFTKLLALCWRPTGVPVPVRLSNDAQPALDRLRDSLEVPHQFQEKTVTISPSASP